MKKNEKLIRVPFLWILIAFASGIFASSYFHPLSTTAISIVGTASCFLLFSLGQHSKQIWQATICLLLLCSGYLRHHASYDNESQIPHTPREATISLKIQKVFASAKPSRFSGIAIVLEAPNYFVDIQDRRIYFSLSIASEAERPINGEIHQATGVVRSLDSTSENTSSGFENYLKNQQVNYRIQQGYLRKKQANAPTLYRISETSRNHLAKVLETNALPQSQTTGSYKAIILGQKQALSPEQKALFLQNGAMHLFAISGLHIGVIAACIHHLITLIRIKSSLRPFIVLIVILCFVITTGGAASSWRALLMTVCFYACSVGRRQTSPFAALVLSCLIYLVILPHQLFQAGFQMSYLTVTSILLLGLPLARTLNRIIVPFKDIPKGLQSRLERLIVTSKTWILSGFAVSLAAYMTAAPLGAYYFQILPTYGILTNLIILPIASLAITSGFLAILFSPLSFLPISELFNNAAIVILSLIHWLMHKIANLPYAAIEVPEMSSLFLFCSLASTVVLIAWSQSIHSKNNRGLWQLSPIALSAMTLIAMVGFS